MAMFPIVYTTRWLAQVLKGQVGSWGEIIGRKGWKYETNKETMIVNPGIVWRGVMRVWWRTGCESWRKRGNKNDSCFGKLGNWVIGIISCDDEHWWGGAGPFLLNSSPDLFSVVWFVLSQMNNANFDVNELSTQSHGSVFKLTLWELQMWEPSHHALHQMYFGRCDNPLLSLPHLPMGSPWSEEMPVVQCCGPTGSNALLYLNRCSEYISKHWAVKCFIPY